MNPKNRIAFWTVGALVAGGAPAADTPKENPAAMNVYIGTYTRGSGSQGIYRLPLDLATGKLGACEVAAEVDNPSFLAVHPNLRFLYAVGELAEFGGVRTGAVSAFAIDPSSGKLTLLNQQPSGGAGPCHLIVDAAGRNVLVANYSAGTVEVLPITSDGALAPPSCIVAHEDPEAVPGAKPRAPHCHSINLDAAQRYAFVADLGLDRVFSYRFDVAAGTLTPNVPPAAVLAAKAGPRHFAWHPAGRFASVINELNSTLTTFAFDADTGVLREIQTVSTLPEGFVGANACAEVQVHPSGRFLYGSNRGHDSIAVFAIDPQTGKLGSLGHESTQGKVPRGFAVDPTGQYLLVANQGSGTLVVFRIDPQSGLLRATGQTVAVPAPVCVRFMPGPPLPRS